VAGRRVMVGVMAPSLSAGSGVIGVPHVDPEVSPAVVGSLPSSRRDSLVQLGPSVMRSPSVKWSKVLSSRVRPLKRRCARYATVGVRTG
jgi:hypothetical protein